MLQHNLQGSPLEGKSASKPLIDDNSQRILVTGWTRFSPALLRGHVCWCACCLRLQAHQGTLLQHLSNTKVAQQDGAVSSQEHIFRLDIAVDNTAVMSIL